MADDKTGLLKGKPNDVEGIYYEQSPASVCIYNLVNCTIEYQLVIIFRYYIHNV